MNEIRVQCLANADVDPKLEDELGRLYTLCFPPTHVSPSSQEPCLVPAHRFIMRSDDGFVVATLALHDRTIHSTAGELKIGGVAGVCVHPNCRLKGCARALLVETHHHLRAQNVPFALLFGRREFYESSGYKNVTNVIRSYDRNIQGIVERQHSNLMVATLGPTPWPDGLIDLNGPDF